MLPFVSTKNLSVIKSGVRLLDNVSFQIKKGDFVALIGPNGAGKTTLLHHLIQGMMNANHHITYQGNRPTIGYVPQQHQHNHRFPASVREVISLGLLNQKTFPKIITPKDKKRISQIENNLGLKHLIHKSFATLSGGQKQLVLLARSLVSSSDLLIFDEATTGLDPAKREFLIELLHHLNQQHRTTIIFATHDLDDIKPHINKILYLDRTIKFFGDKKSFQQFMKKQKKPSRINCHDH